jgi:hypothetical protein
MGTASFYTCYSYGYWEDDLCSKRTVIGLCDGALNKWDYQHQNIGLQRILNCKGRGRKRQWTHLRYCLGICLYRLTKGMVTPSGEPVSKKRYEPRTTRIWNRIAAQSAKMLGHLLHSLEGGWGTFPTPTCLEWNGHGLFRPVSWKKKVLTSSHDCLYGFVTTLVITT